MPAWTPIPAKPGYELKFKVFETVLEAGVCGGSTGGVGRGGADDSGVDKFENWPEHWFGGADLTRAINE